MVHFNDFQGEYEDENDCNQYRKGFANGKLEASKELSSLRSMLGEAREIIEEMLKGADLLYGELFPELISFFCMLQQHDPENEVIRNQLDVLNRASVIEENSTVDRARKFLSQSPSGDKG